MPSVAEPIMQPQPSPVGARAITPSPPNATDALVETRPSDEELACRAQGGSLSCFGELVDRYEGRLTGFLRKRAGQDAEDVAQETFVRAWEKIATYDPSRRFSTWLFTIASRLATDRWRSRESERTAVARVKARANPEVRAHDDDPSEVWILAGRMLTPEVFEALWLRYVAGMGVGEVATVLGRTKVGVRVLLFRARERLASELKRINNDADRARAEDEV